MKHCSITDLSDRPSTANLLANQHLLKRYFDTTGECDQFAHAAVKLYDQEDSGVDAYKFNYGPRTPKSDDNLLCYPIIYQRKRIGDLSLCGNSAAVISEPQSAKVRASAVARKIALLVKRDQANTLSGLYLGKPLSLEGYSEAVFGLEAFIEKAAGTYSPVVIEGDFGSEKLEVASSIHFNSQRKHQPFIELTCSASSQTDFQQRLINCFTKAKGGSIYLHDIDELSIEQQSLLVELLAASSEHNLDMWPQINTADVRLIVSTTTALPSLVKQGRFSRALYARLDFLHVNLPRLSERKEDLSAIIDQLVKRHRLYREQYLSDDVEKALCQYHWPENYQQLERIIARLLALANSNPISLHDLNLCAPQITSKAQVARNQGFTQYHEAQQSLIPSLMAQNYQPFKPLHNGLQKALRFLAENYSKEITLTQLAQNACVSPSHLSYLLKFYLGHSFKQILAELRIEKAKLLFDANPHARITDAALDVGFGDLSHFEKIFKRYTCLTPRQYKNSRR